jgi:hypothetical protein
MRLPFQVPPVIREALHWPTAPLFRGLAPSVGGPNCVAPKVACNCGNDKYACCNSGQACSLNVNQACACN